MVYLGSKNRLSKYLVPIIESYITDDTSAYIEPFVGGGNIIDKIHFDNKIGYDSHKQLIALLQHTQQTLGLDFPLDFTKEEYYNVKDNQDRYEDWYVGLVGFAGSYCSKYFNGYASCYRKDGISRVNEQIRNIIKQAPNLAGIHFECADFRDVVIPDNSVVYCDPPYFGVTKYKGTEPFPYEEFYDWCRKQSKYNTVLISEYSMPDDFKCIWSKTLNCDVSSQRKNTTKKQEKLFTI